MGGNDFSKNKATPNQRDERKLLEEQSHPEVSGMTPGLLPYRPKPEAVPAVHQALPESKSLSLGFDLLPSKMSFSVWVIKDNTFYGGSLC